MKNFLSCLWRIGRVVLDGAEALARARRVARDLGVYGQRRPYWSGDSRWIDR